MSSGLRPRTIAAVFGVFFVIIGVAAWQFEQGPNAFKYDAELTRWVYTTYMAVAAIFLVGLAGLGLSIRSSFGRQIREIDMHLGDMVRGSEGLPPPLPESRNMRDTVDRDIDELLESLTEVEATAQREAQRMDSGDPSAAMAGYEDDQGLAERRERLLYRRRYLNRFLIGPGVVAGIILGLSGMMLPGSDAFAQSEWRLNTTLILGIGYSWIGVGWYIAATVFGLVGGGREGRRR